MTTISGKSRPRDRPKDGIDIDGSTGQLRLPTSSRAGLYCAAADRPPGISRLLATTLCVAVLALTATVVLAVIEEVRNAPAVSHTTMMLLSGASAVAWTAVITVLVRDRMTHNQQVLRSIGTTIEARLREQYDRQEHLAHRITDLANRQAEQMQLMRQVAASVAAVRREMADVIGVADADAELQLRQAVNDGHRLPGGGLYVVPPED
ncbi:hypothetical protein ACGF5C_31765 [Micromonospora sp. NPDC047620]|uniref:hypothetical protein n=1 Tax=Micromonospora sp. NPDC047620 TaxID=3364251 RepID=UPI00371014E4